MLQYKFYQDPGKVKESVDSVIATTPIAFMSTTYCLFSTLYQFMETIENLFGKMYIDDNLMSKSHNSALTRDALNCGRKWLLYWV